MNEKKIIICLALFTFIIILGGVLLLSLTSTSAPQVNASSDAIVYTVEPTSFDWGEIQYSGKKATKIFTIKNNGKDTLKLYNIKTSCHCTNAYVTIDGKDSPRFGMSGISSWVGEVAPKKAAKLTVVFDQSFHGPQGIGPVTRFVSIETNDQGTAKLTFTLTGTVVK